MEIEIIDTTTFFVTQNTNFACYLFLNHALVLDHFHCPSQQSSRDLFTSQNLSQQHRLSYSTDSFELRKHKKRTKSFWWLLQVTTIMYSFILLDINPKFSKNSCVCLFFFYRVCNSSKCCHYSCFFWLMRGLTSFQSPLLLDLTLIVTFYVTYWYFNHNDSVLHAVKPKSNHYPLCNRSSYLGDNYEFGC